MKLNTIYHGNAKSALKMFPSNSIDLTVTSPPYDKLRKYGDCEWNFKKFEKIAKQLYRITKEGGVVVWIVGDTTVDGSETGSSFKQALYFQKIGFRLHDTMIFEKNTTAYPSGSKSVRYTNIFEYMFVLSKGRPKTINLIRDKPNKYTSSWGNAQVRNSDDSRQKTDKKIKVHPFGVRNNIWKYQVQGGQITNDKIAHKHPAIFPEKLVYDHIVSWSNEGDVVLDPFAGSGTTLKVARLLKRKFVGVERNKEYITDIIIPRLKQYDTVKSYKNYNFPYPKKTKKN